MDQKKKIRRKIKSGSKSFDPEYPERHRKKGIIRGSYENVSKPFRIGVIERIVSTDKSTSARSLRLKIRKLLRPHDLPRKVLPYPGKEDFEKVYWTEDFYTDTSVYAIIGMCYVKYCHPSKGSEWVSNGPDRFYFNQTYDKGQVESSNEDVASFESCESPIYYF